ncbi:MAG: hypothetical protein AAGL10_07360 [Pseudomonadota bacterium]
MVSKGRSPRYPRISLGEAIAYARRLYDEAHTTKVDSDTAAILMGFRGRSGASAVALGAVRQYGLVDGLRGDLQISDLALEILQPVSTAEQAEAKSKSAFLPEVFGQLRAHFNGNFPRADEPIRAHLIRNMGFSQTGATDCIESLRKTLEEIESVAGWQPENVTEAKSEEESVADSSSQSPKSSEGPKPAAQPSQEPEAAGAETILIPLSKNCKAELRLLGEIDEAAINRLIQYIELMKDVWTE